LGIEDGEEVRTKGVENIFNKIRGEKLPNLRKRQLYTYKRLWDIWQTRPEKKLAQDIIFKQSMYRK
jgi:hypothetical protein